jgi:ATP-dependent Clp protease ATP-binding subunit ClpC
MAANVIRHSRSAAFELNHNYIGTEHILIGLLREKEGLACQVLEDAGITEDKVMNLVSQLISGGSTSVAEPEEYTPRSRRILDISNKEAARTHASAIGTEHLLIAILKENDCVAAQLLATLGVNFQKLYKSILQGMGQSPQQGSQEFDIPFNRQQLADYLSVDRSAMSNELSKMQRDGLLQVDRNHFRLTGIDPKDGF